MHARVFFLVSVLILAGCRGDRLPRPSPATPVILISIDTLRSDHLPAYGYTRVDTPNIDALRRDAILYERAYSHCPLTLPSHATIFTGLLPADTGVRDNTGYSLAPGVKTLAQRLKERGYATGAAVSSFVIRKESGLNRGFDFYDDDIESKPGVWLPGIQRDGADTIETAKPWISANRQKPFFFVLHMYEPHSPYEPPEPFRTRYASPYDGEIARSDALVGDFLMFLKNSGLYEASLIILFSDHGEALGEHGEDEHGIFLYRETLQVPLMVKLPGQSRAGSSVSTPVSLSDIFPTVLHQTATPHNVVVGGAESLLSYLDPEKTPRAIYSETYFPRFHFGWSDLHSLIGGTYHFIEAPTPELYDLELDPSEVKSVLRENRRIFAGMRRTIESLIRPAEAPQPVNAEEASKLAALGYLGSTVPTEGPLPDPKTKTETFRRIREGFRRFRSGEYQEALTMYQELLEENPRMLDLWSISAHTLMNLGRREEAIAAAKEALKLDSQTSHMALLIATTSLELGNLEQAVQHAELALQREPAAARELLARVALARGDLRRAENEAKLALRADPERARGLVIMARVEKQKKNLDVALARLDEAVEVLRTQKKPPLTGLHFLRGDVLARLGRSAEAEQAFREEIRLFPHEAAAYRNLIVLLVAEERLDEATRLIYDLEKASPTQPAYAAISQTLQVVGDQRGARFWALRGLRRFPGDPTLRRLAG